MREEIDHLRRERATFETIYKKLDRELHEKKKEMVNVIEISNIAYEARDQANNEVAALRAQVATPKQSVVESPNSTTLTREESCLRTIYSIPQDESSFHIRIPF